MKYTTVFLLFILLCFSYFRATAQETTVSEIYPYMIQYQADLSSFNKSFTIHVAEERLTNLKIFYKERITSLESLDFKKLSQNGKVDYLLFRRNLEQKLAETEQNNQELIALYPLIPFKDKIIQLETSRRQGIYQKPQETANLVNELKKQIATAQKDAEKSPKLSASQAKLASASIKNLQKNFQIWFDFYETYDPLFTWWVSKPYEEADSLLSEYAKFLSAYINPDTRLKDDGSGIIGNPIGREKLIQQLKYEMIPYTPEELIEIANREFAWCEVEMKKASATLGFGDNWKNALEKVKTLYVEPGKQPELIRKLADEAIDFLEKNQLVTVPALAKTDWNMSMMTPERQLVAPFFLGGEDIIISYPTSTMSHDAKMMSLRGNNIHFSRAVVHHELIPGHHLQYYMLDRYKTYRESFNTPFWIEGWALYWEMLLWDKKFPQTPEDRVGMLFWRMHRCARIIFSLGFHTGKMTPKQCIDFLVEKVGHERANAEGEVRRSFTGGYGPLYQIAYMIGGLQFRALHKELVDSGKMTDKAFHDRILQEYAMPVEMVRALLTNQPLTANFSTKWRFAD
jgi:uncharacterized protein (DUF885 family)